LTQLAWKSVLSSYESANATKQGIAVFNPTGWNRATEIMEVDMSSLIPNAERLLNGRFHQMSADGKKALVIGKLIAYLF
jgi:hypothetical protein